MRGNVLASKVHEAKVHEPRKRVEAQKRKVGAFPPSMEKDHGELGTTEEIKEAGIHGLLP